MPSITRTESATDLRLQPWLAWDTDAAPNTHQMCVRQVVLVPVARPGDDATCINKRYDSLQESFQVSLTALRLVLSGNTSLSQSAPSNHAPITDTQDV